MSAFQTEFESLHIPPNIDPRLLELWIEREHAEIESKRRERDPPREVNECGRSLERLFPAYIGITVMCLTIVLGLIQGKEPSEILQMTCIAFLVYGVIGYIVGIIMERCVNDSVETLLREVIARNKAEPEVEPQLDQA